MYEIIVVLPFWHQLYQDWSQVASQPLAIEKTTFLDSTVYPVWESKECGTRKVWTDFTETKCVFIKSNLSTFAGNHTQFNWS